MVARYLLGLVFFYGLAHAEQAPFFDVHTHYKWNQADVTSPQQVIDHLEAAGVERAMVIGTPPRLALQIKELAPERIIAFYGPYVRGGEKLSWQFRKELLEEARAGLQSGDYEGIGELHLIGGQAVRWERSPVFVGLLALAREFDVPIMLHTEYASIEPTVSICQSNPGNRLLLAHAGAVLPPSAVAKILDVCPNVTMGLAARDPWRYVRHPISDADGQLLSPWRELILAYPERFVVGSDTVWPVDRLSRWDQDDTGWDELKRFLDFHRGWMAGLPESVERALRWENAARFFQRGGEQALVKEKIAAQP